MGELLTGSRKVVTDYKLYMKLDQKASRLCQLHVTPEIIHAFQEAVDEDYEISFLFLFFSVFFSIRLKMFP